MRDVTQVLLQVKMPSVTEWAAIPEYLELPADTLECAVSSWRSVSKHAPEIDGVWLPINHNQEIRKSSPLEKSVVRALQSELNVPIMQEAVLEGSYVAVDVAIVGKAKRRRSAVFVAVEVQGPHHFVSKVSKERRSSRVKQLLRQHAGWHVVALNFKEWKSTGLKSRRHFLRDKLSVLPEHCWKAEDTESVA
jgi:RAP domain